MYTSLNTLMMVLPVRKSPKRAGILSEEWLRLDLYHHFGVKPSFSTPHNWSSCDDIAGWHRAVTPWPGDIRSHAMACRLRSRHTPLMTKTWRSPSICLDPLRQGAVAFNLRHFEPVIRVICEVAALFFFFTPQRLEMLASEMVSIREKFSLNITKSSM